MRLVKKYQTGNVLPYNQRVKEFFEYDVLPRFKRENPDATEEQINKIRSAYTGKQLLSNNLSSDTLGGWDPTQPSGIEDLKGSIIYNKNKEIPLTTVVHENTHQIRQGGTIDFSNFSNQGYSDKELKYINDGLEFLGNRLSDNPKIQQQKETAEMGVLYPVARFQLWNKLYNKNKTIPTLEQTDDYIKSKNKPYILDPLVNGSNGYGIQIKDYDKFIEGMLHVADNNSYKQHDLV